ncbi:MAG: DNA ligase D [Betaproteobacteria bacterium]
MPQQLSPQLATLVTAIPSAGDWLYEIKFDGYRMLARLENGEARLFTRRGHDWSSKMPGLIDELERLGVHSGWLDGEVVVQGEDGAPSFNALQNSFDQRVSGEIVYFLFDVPFLEGFNLRGVPLRQRRLLLETLLQEKQTDRVRFSTSFDADPESLLSSARQMQLEGIVAKRADAPYVSRRSETWLKLKCKHRQEFVVCGYTNRSGGTTQIGSLLLGIYDAAGALVSAGSVGTGWSSDEASTLKTKLSKLDSAKSPFSTEAKKSGRWSKRRPSDERWVVPGLVAEVEFSEWTPDGQIRHATYIAMRTDKPAKSISRERAESVGGKASAPRVGTPAGIKVSHGERIIDPSSGFTKLQLVRYYESVGDWILPHLKGRPCSLVRGPSGIGGELFFQKHGDKIGIPGIKELDASLWPGHAALLEIGNAQALAGAAQLNVIEFHTWNSMARNIDKPDRMIFDLDPGEGATWKHMQDAASLMRAMLDELDLDSWLKTSGGKGLHVVVPLVPRLDFEVVKGFSQAIVQHLAKTLPERFVAKSGPANRIGKIFVDYIRNGHGATTAAAFSARARPGLGVSMPVAWDALPNLKSGAQWSIATAHAHLTQQMTDPWAAYWNTKQSLEGAMKKLGFRARARGARKT